MASPLYFLDAYNLLHHEASLVALLQKDPAAARSLFYNWLTSSANLHLEDLRVVVDGARLPTEQPPVGLAISWAAAPENADQRLLKLLLREARRARSHRPLILVSDDRGLRDQARFRGAQLMACAAFLRDFLPEMPPRTQPEVTDGSGRDCEEDQLARDLKRQGRKGLRVRKGGAGISEAEAEKWLEVFDVDESEMESAAEDASGSETVSDSRETGEWEGAAPLREVRAPKKAGADGPAPMPSGAARKSLKRRSKLSPDEIEYARLLGVDPDDPGLYDPDPDDDIIED